MKSKRATGTEFQNWCERWILKEFPGSAVHNFKPVQRKIFTTNAYGEKKEIWVSSKQDLFNCIDLEVKLPHCGKMIYIQVTAHTGVQKRIDELITVSWNFDYQTVQLWQKKGPGRIVVQQARYGDKGLELYKIGEIQRGKYVPFIGKGICDEVKRVEAL